jgi:hypothetical protein
VPGTRPIKDLGDTFPLTGRSRETGPSVRPLTSDARPLILIRPRYVKTHEQWTVTMAGIPMAFNKPMRELPYRDRSPEVSPNTVTLLSQP